MESTLEIIKARRSCRVFKPVVIDREQVENILEVGTYAPHGMGITKRTFTALCGDEYVEKANAAIRAGLQVMPVTPDTNPRMLEYIEKAKDPNSDFLYGANVLIIVSESTKNYNGAVDCGTAMENMLIAAEALCLQACWLNQLTLLDETPAVAALKKELDIPADHKIYASMALGVGDLDKYQAPPRRPDINAINLFE